MSYFTSGSRQAPDPYDQFLEENNFYRKHTARDSSCLFRVISEQLFDTQIHHYEIRRKCVYYMRKHHFIFNRLVDQDFKEYLDELLKPRTFGSLVELQALSFLYKRDVILFEPFCLGRTYLSHPKNEDCFRVFYSSDYHFDSVFTCDYMKKIALCQSVCYEIMYKEFFKLPDVEYAVEYMLRMDNADTSVHDSEYNEKGYCTRAYVPNGQLFDFDLPENTNCILENKKCCNFHNSGNLQANANQVSETNDKTYVQSRQVESVLVVREFHYDCLLPNKYVSCVRQLLNEGITPFPYKVAKSLDALMYRNIEFDSWNELRKEFRYPNIYNSESDFMVGAKCHVKLSGSFKLYTGYIQEIFETEGSCLVFLEELGEKHLVPYESINQFLSPEFQSWPTPYRTQRYIQKLSTMRLARNSLGKYDGRLNYDYGYYGKGQNKIKSLYHRKDCIYNVNQFTQLDNFQAQAVEYCAMPVHINYGICNSAEGIPLVATERRPNGVPNGNHADHDIQPRQPQSSHDFEMMNGIPIPPPIHYPHIDGSERGSYNSDFHPIESQAPYPMHYYANSVDYYPYTSGNAQPQQYVYMYNPSSAVMPQNNIFVQPAVPPTMQPALSHVLPQMMPMHAGQQQQNLPPMPPAAPIQSQPYAGYYNLAQYYAINSQYPPYNGNYWNPYAPSNLSESPNSSHFEGANIEPAESNNVTSTNETPSNELRPENSENLTNSCASRSTLSDGSDLPADIGTLRYFYNLGVDAHNLNLTEEIRGIRSGIAVQNPIRRAFDRANSEPKNNAANNSAYTSNTHSFRNNEMTNNVRSNPRMQPNNRRMGGRLRERNGSNRFNYQNVGNRYAYHENGQNGRYENNIHNPAQSRFGAFMENVTENLNSPGTGIPAWYGPSDVPVYSMMNPPPQNAADPNGASPFNGAGAVQFERESEKENGKRNIDFTN